MIIKNYLSIIAAYTRTGPGACALVFVAAAILYWVPPRGAERLQRQRQAPPWQLALG
jgi:hypothetical protein